MNEPVTLNRDLPALPDFVREYVRASKAENTIGAYRTDWRDFGQWCVQHQLCAEGCASVLVSL